MSLLATNASVGIALDGSSTGVTLDNLAITNSNTAVRVATTAGGATIRDSTITGARRGIESTTAAITILDNTISGALLPGRWAGISIDAPTGTGAVVSGNSAANYGPSEVNSLYNDFGFYIRAAGFSLTGNTATNNAIGFWFEGAGTSSGNTATGNSETGFYFSGNGTHTGNTATGNAIGFATDKGFTGVMSASVSHENHTGILVAGGTVRGNTVTGGPGSVDGIRVDYWRNNGDFDGFAAPSVVENNTVRGFVHGLVVGHAETLRVLPFLEENDVATENGSTVIRGNLFHDNSGAAVRIDGYNYTTLLVNNTIIADGANAIHITESSRDVTLDSNIIVANGAGFAALRVENSAQRGFSAEYNIYHGTGGAHAIHWQRAFNNIPEWWQESGFDRHSLMVDPMFSDAPNDDFTLATGSPGRAAANPSREARNIGAFDDELAGPGIRILSLHHGEKRIGGTNHIITWESLVTTSGLVLIEFSSDGGANWQTLATTTDDGAHYISLPLLGSVAPDARLRVSDANNSLLGATVAFALGVPTTTYYASTTGSTANTGTTAADPMPSLAALVHAYDLTGASVQIAAGTYDTVVTLDMANGINVAGTSAILNRGNQNTGATLLASTSTVSLSGLTLSGAATALTSGGAATLANLSFIGNLLGLSSTGTLAISNSSFSGNTTSATLSGTANFTGVAISVGNLGFDLTNANVTLLSTTVTGGQTGARLNASTLTGGNFANQTIRSIELAGTAGSGISGATLSGSAIGVGVTATNGTHRVRNVIFSGNSLGVQAANALASGGALIVLNNTFHGNAVTHVSLANTSDVRLLNNIFSGTGSTAISADTPSSVGFFSNYALFDSTLAVVAHWQGNAQVTLTAWRTTSGFDTASVSANPGFVDAANGNFHLAPGSAAIDAGDPFTPVGNEPTPNGGRADLGAYGTTSEATASIPVSLAVLSPTGNDRIEVGETATVTWTSSGTGAVRAWESHRNALLALDPIAYLPFDVITGGLFFDYSTIGNDFTGSALNGTNTTTGAFTGSGAALFDGLDDVVTLPSLNSLVSSPFSLGMWIRPVDGIANDAVLMSMHETGFFTGFQLHYRDGKVVFSVRNSVFGLNPFAQAAVSLNVWTHVVATYDGDGIDLYLNGNLVASAGYTSPIALSTGSLLIEVGGDANNGDGNMFKGSMDDVAIFGDALTPAEIAGLFAARTGAAGGAELTVRVNGQVIATETDDDGVLLWTVPAGFAQGPAVLTIQSSMVTGTSQSFLIVNGGNEFFINDDSVAPGDTTTAVGNDNNSGKSASAPMRNLSELLRLYDLNPGDVIHIDHGIYTLSDEIVIGAQDAGVTIRGPETGSATFDRANRGTGTTVFRIAGANGVTMENLRVTGAEVGISVEAAASFTLRDSVVYENAAAGVRSDLLSTLIVIEDNTFHGIAGDESRDQDEQLDLDGGVITVTGNTVFLNGITAFNPFAGNVGIRVLATIGFTVNDNTVYNINEGIVLATDSGSAAFGTLTGNLSRDNGRGIDVYGQSSVFIQFHGNTARDNQYYGIRAGGRVEVYGNLSTENDIGIEMSGGIYHSFVRIGVDDARGGNTVSLNRVGIVAGDAFVHRNIVYGNTEDGILITGTSDAQITGNKVYSNGNFGVSSGSSTSAEAFAARVENNLIYDNGNGGISFNTGNFNFTRIIRNNTVMQDAGIGIRIYGNGTGLILTNNIVVINAGDAFVWPTAFVAGAVSNFNMVHLATGAARFGSLLGVAQATLAAWKTASGRDLQSLAANPLFVDPDGPDNILGYDNNTNTHGGADDIFSLRSGSPAIDAGESLNDEPRDLDLLDRRDDPGTPNSGGLDYVISTTTTGSVFDSPLGGTALGLRANNASQQITLPFTFSFFGTGYSTAWVSTNGLIQFSSSLFSGNGSNSTGLLDDMPRIAGLWDDLRTDAVPADNVFTQTFADRFVIRWDASNPADGNSDVQFAVTLYTNGSIRFDYGAGNTNLTPTVGISDGTTTTGRTVLTPADGLSNLNFHPSILLAWAPGFTDIGAYEFGGSSTDTTSPTITGATPSAVLNNGVLVSAGVNVITLATSEAINPIGATSSAAYTLLGAGDDKTFGTTDDFTIDLVPGYVSGTTTISLVLVSPLDEGLYRLVVEAGALSDLAGLPLAGDGTTPGTAWTREFSIGSGVVRAGVAYAGSSYDTGSANLQSALASDKFALTPGQAAGFSNISTYSRGLNAIVLDIANAGGGITASDLAFTMGNHAFIENWVAAPAPLSITELAGQGTDGSDRLIIRWADGAIANTWLRVVLKAGGATNLESDQSFYFGHQHGDIGAADTVGTHSVVAETDASVVKANPKGFLNPATITNVHDFNRDGRVNALDFGYARDGANDLSTALILFTAPIQEATPRVINRQLFYNNSVFDGKNANATTADNNGIAFDKVALLPGQSAGFQHYTSYSKGINGLAIDFAHDVSALGMGDLYFRAGSDGNFANWTSAPAPTALLHLPGQGVGGSNRILLTWADGSLTNTWLEINVLATPGSGLDTADVFWFGNVVGETGNSSSNTAVDASDRNAVLANPRSFANPAAVDDIHDFNRDGLVNAFDFAIARDNATNVLTDLDLITAPAQGFVPVIANRQIFYNNSAFDGNDPAANALDNHAVAIDKVALRPGETATFANYTSYHRGINGIAIDFTRNVSTIGASDFSFRTGNNQDSGAWSAAPAPASIVVLAGSQPGVASRVLLSWADGSLVNTWLEVTVLANATTGLSADDVFWFGNAIGETGNLPGNTAVDTADSSGVVANPHSVLNPAAIDDDYDFNRDRKVNAFDFALARDHATVSGFELILLTGFSLLPSSSAPSFFNFIPDDPEDPEDDENPL